MWGVRNPVGVLAVAVLMVLTIPTAAALTPEKSSILVSLLSVAIWFAAFTAEAFLLRYMVDGAPPKQVIKEFRNDG